MALASALFLSTLYSGLSVPAIPVWRDDFLDLRLVDLAGSTATIDTQPPGRAELPLEPAALAWHPRRTALLVGTTGGVSLWRPEAVSGTLVQDERARVEPPENLPAGSAVVGVAWLGLSGSAFTVAWPGEVRLYRLNGAGQAIPLGAWPSPEAVIGLAADGPNLWIAHPTGLRYLGVAPAGMIEVPQFALPDLGRVRAIASHGPAGLLAVLAENELRLFRRASGGYLEVVPAPLNPREGARALAFWADGSGLWALGPGWVEAIGLTSQGAEVIPSWRHSAPRHAVALAAAGAGRDYSLIVLPALQTVAWDAASGAPVPLADRSLEDLGGRRYARRAELRSVVWDVSEPVERLRLEAAIALPPGTAVEFEGTTDGGATWTPLPRDQVVPVPPGTRVGYRASLTSRDSLATPEIDWIELSEVRALTYLTRAGRVRLVR